MIDCLKGERDAAYAKRLAAAKSASDPQHVVVGVAVDALVVGVDSRKRRLLSAVHHDFLLAVAQIAALEAEYALAGEIALARLGRKETYLKVSV